MTKMQGWILLALLCFVSGQGLGTAARSIHENWQGITAVFSTAAGLFAFQAFIDRKK